jgi:hypothetical protein
MFHKHNFQEIERFYAEPLRAEGGGNPISGDGNYKIALFGQTTILYKCEKCGKTRTETILGKSIK